MESTKHPVTHEPEIIHQLNDTQELTPTFKIENITVIKPLLLKIYYWESLQIEQLNNALTSKNPHIDHHLKLPTCQLNSMPLKIVFWLRNLSNFEYVMHLKRIKNCQCTPQETRIGFNQFRNLYHCPHRRLINITQEVFIMKPGELLAMSAVAYSYVLGKHMLSYELRISESRIIMLNFHVDIVIFDPLKCVITSKLIPVDIKEHRGMFQPIWIRNITTQNLDIKFSEKSSGLKLINPKMTIPRQSVWPLIVEYKASDFQNDVELFLTFGEDISAKGNVGFKIPLTCKSYINTQDELDENNAPLLDNECSNYLYVVYPNKLEFTSAINEEKSLMVAVHNYNQKCMEFKWQTYTINEYFSFTFEPKQFTLKPHHSKLCVVQVKTFAKPLHFKRIPAVLEIHRIFDKSTQIAKELLTEIESIDDPKWSESSYVEHVLLQIDLKVEFPKLQRINITELSDMEKQKKIDNLTIFEKLFWENLSKSNYMRNTSKISRNLSYDQVINKESCNKPRKSCLKIDKQGVVNILSFLTAEACRDLSKNYRFIPSEILDTI